MEQVKQEQAKPIVEDAPVVHPDFVAWSNRNNWYNSVGYMRKWADDFGLTLADSGLSPRDVLKRVEEAVRKEFPQKFVNPNKENAPSVENGKTTNRSGSKRDDFQMSDQEERIMNTLIKSDPAKFTKEKYIEDLKKIKGIK
jgi:hypothetical protein